MPPWIICLFLQGPGNAVLSAIGSLTSANIFCSPHHCWCCHSENTNKGERNTNKGEDVNKKQKASRYAGRLCYLENKTGLFDPNRYGNMLPNKREALVIYLIGKPLGDIT
jgi:hypothetical protein